MLKVEREVLDRMEATYPGICSQIQHFEEAALPNCPYCGSEDTADVQCGIIGRTIYIAHATTKFKLIANNPREGEHFCNSCERFFD